MDLVTVTDAMLGLANAAIRITEIEEDDNGFLSVTAEEFPLGVASATLYPTQAVGNTPINRDVAADPVNPPIIFEPPAALVGATPQVWIAASGGAAGVADPNWGGCFVWLSLDGTSYSQIGTIDAAVQARRTITAALAGYLAGAIRIPRTPRGDFGRERRRAGERILRPMRRSAIRSASSTPNYVLRDRRR